jgi:hypothetical protein
LAVVLVARLTSTATFTRKALSPLTSSRIVQHNGFGTVYITDFFADTFGKVRPFPSGERCAASANVTV